MKRKKSAQGYAVIFLETDLSKASPIELENMSDIQKAAFSRMRDEEREKVLTGLGTVVVSLGTGDTICDYNMANYQPPKSAIDQMARSLLPLVKEFYANEENRKKFEVHESTKSDDT